MLFEKKECMTNEKPVFEMKLRQIRASVFKNQTKDGRPFFNTQLVRRYQSGQNEWSNSSTFTGISDLLIAKYLTEEVLGFLRGQGFRVGEE